MLAKCLLSYREKTQAYVVREKQAYVVRKKTIVIKVRLRHNLAQCLTGYTLHAFSMER